MTNLSIKGETDGANKFVVDPQDRVLKAGLALENHIMVSLNDARRVIAAAEDKARELGQPMNIAADARYMQVIFTLKYPSSP